MGDEQQMRSGFIPALPCNINSPITDYITEMEVAHTSEV